MAESPTTVIVKIVGEADVANVDELRAMLLKPVHDVHTTVVDCRSCEFVDSVTLGVFLEAHMAADANGGRLVLVAPKGGTVRNIIEMAHLDTILIVVNDLESVASPSEGL